MTKTNSAPIAAAVSFSKKDLFLGIFSGLLIGLLILPILKAAKPELFQKVYLVIVPFFLIGTPFGLFVAYLISKKISLIWQVAKFGVTGVLNTLVDIGSLTLITFIFRNYLGIESTKVIFSIITFYSLFKACSFVIANINSYYWNKHWTFSTKQGAKTPVEILQFFTVSIIGFIINVSVSSLVFKAIVLGTLTNDQAGLIGAAIGSVTGLAWNFLGYKFIVFKK